jgi:tetratricopeptide (TPR) repeat protein
MRSSLALAIAVLLALGAGAARADWKKDYDRGLKAIEAGQWAEAEAAFRAALADDPEPNARKRFQGVVMKPYLPHYYAGLAAYRQGDCPGALEYWQHGPTSTVVATQPELQAVKSKGLADCNQKLAAASKPATPAATGPVVASTPAKPAASPTAPPARPPVATPPPATTPAKPNPPPATTVATAQKPVAPSATPPPPALVSALESYLAGRYAAVTQFDPATLADGRAKAQGFLLRAASRYTLAQLAEGDPAQLDQARRDVRAARSANAAIDPDETAFSPRFRAFWRETR